MRQQIPPKDHPDPSLIIPEGKSLAGPGDKANRVSVAERLVEHGGIAMMHDSTTRQRQDTPTDIALAGRKEADGLENWKSDDFESGRRR